MRTPKELGLVPPQAPFELLPMWQGPYTLARAREIHQQIKGAVVPGSEIALAYHASLVRLGFAGLVS